jgi:hypothetical protein
MPFPHISSSLAPRHGTFLSVAFLPSRTSSPQRPRGSHALILLCLCLLHSPLYKAPNPHLLSLQPFLFPGPFPASHSHLRCGHKAQQSFRHFQVCKACPSEVSSAAVGYWTRALIRFFGRTLRGARHSRYSISRWWTGSF